MALWDKLMGELVDIVEWLDDSNNTLAYRFERYQNEIKYGAKLVVRCDGPDEERAVDEIAALFADRFGESE